MTNDEAIEILDAVKDVKINMEGHSAVTEAIAHAIACLREREWQPIETAPKDGTRIIVTRRKYPAEFFAPIRIVRWANRNGWRYTRYKTLPFKPDFWQPLPQPPREGDV